MTKQTNTAAATLANVNVAFCENNNTTFNVDGVDYFATLGAIADTDTDGNDRIFTDSHRALRPYPSRHGNGHHRDRDPSRRPRRPRPRSAHCINT